MGERHPLLREEHRAGVWPQSTGHAVSRELGTAWWAGCGQVAKAGMEGLELEAGQGVVPVGREQSTVLCVEPCLPQGWLLRLTQEPLDSHNGSYVTLKATVALT